MLKYLGDGIYQIPDRIQKAVAISVACDLKSCALKLARPENRLYMMYFLRSLHKKIQVKMKLFPGRVHDKNYKDIKTFMEYDNRYTAPLHGFADAEDYYEKTACKSFLPYISRPTLLINAMNDPFLTKQCYPRKTAATNRVFYLEMPISGGHVGFICFNGQKEYWHETRAAKFLCS